jgi:hypothetical protein
MQLTKVQLSMIKAQMFNVLKEGKQFCLIAQTQNKPRE